MRIELGFLRDHNGVDIHHAPSGFANRLIGGLQKNGAVGALVIRIGVGEKRADIAQARSTQNSIGDGVQQRVGVAVAVKAQRMFDFDAAENEFAAFHQAM